MASARTPNYQKIEKKWQAFWEKKKVFKNYNRAKKFYVLDMFPYPSGEGLHVGHPRGYIGTDVVARYRMMKGESVLHPMGWDAFGLPAENFAIKHKVHPRQAVEKNIARYKQQLAMFGLTYDWDREINTTDPNYYKWTQWIFLKLFKEGLAYESHEPINWCPSCQTGLANEDLEEGKCERCGSEVERKPMRQWALKMTAYAEQLLRDLKTLDWNTSIIEQQKNWIGRSEGAIVTFKVVKVLGGKYVIQDKQLEQVPGSNKRSDITIDVFTTRLDTIYGCTYAVIAPEHPLMVEVEREKGIGKSIENWQEVKHYIEAAKKKSDMQRTDLAKEKTGVELKGIKAVNPFNNEKIPLFVADYVLAHYGTGAIMAVPAHDERDYEFAMKYKLPIKTVIKPHNLKIVTVHGVADSPEDEVARGHWMPWIKKEFEKKNASVIIPTMPSAWDPSYAEWKKEFEKITVDENTVLIGHSAGCAFLVRWLGEHPKKIRKLILVAPAKVFGQGSERLREMYTFSVNEEIKKYVQDVVIFIADDDEKRFQGSAVEYYEKLGGQMIWKKGKGHFTHSDMGTREFPELGDAIRETKAVFTDDGIVEHSGIFSGLNSETARGKMAKWLTQHKAGKRKVTYKMHDWVFSRQRYWGEPIPLVFCEECHKKIKGISNFQFSISKQTRNSNFKRELKMNNSKLKTSFSLGERLNPGWVAVPEKDLPVTLPEVEQYEPTGTGESPLANIAEWVNVKCPKCKSPAKRETNTMPSWAGSSWYYLRYIDPKNKQAVVDRKKEKQWMPVSLYVGGVEHATRHLLYARFWHKFLYDQGIVSTKEPFQKLVNQGLILASDGRKMSKRWGNVINPDEVVDIYGADSVRLYEMFIGPFDASIAWSTDGLKGMRRFLDRVYNFFKQAKHRKPNVQKAKKYLQHSHEFVVSHRGGDLDRLLHRTIKKVTEDIEQFRFNTAVSAMMIFFNELEKNPKASNREVAQMFLKLLTPFAPHLAEEVWQTAKFSKKSIVQEEWPTYNEALCKEHEIELVVQVNGRVRDKVKVAADISEEEATKTALASDQVRRFIDEKRIKKVIFIKGRLINLVM